MVCLAKSCLFFLPGRDTRRIGGVTKAGHLPFLGKAFLPQAIFREIQLGIRQISYLRHIFMEEFRAVNGPWRNRIMEDLVDPDPESLRFTF